MYVTAVVNIPSDNEETTGSLFEIAGGWAAQTRWQRSGGHSFSTKKTLTPEDIASQWKNITVFGTSFLILSNCHAQSLTFTLQMTEQPTHPPPRNRQSRFSATLTRMEREVRRRSSRLFSLFLYHGFVAPHLIQVFKFTYCLLDSLGR